MDRALQKHCLLGKMDDMLFIFSLFVPEIYKDKLIKL